MASNIASRVTGRLRLLVDMAKEKDDASLRNKIFKNVGWLGIGYGAELCIRLVSSIILTRLLAPGVYGLFETVTAFVAIAVMLSDLGISPLIMADPRGEDRKFLSILWTMQALRGFVVAAMIGAMSLVWLILIDQGRIAPTSTFADPVLPQLLAFTCVTQIIQGFSNLNEYRLIRNMQRARVALLDIIARGATTIVTVLLVYLFRTVQALAVALILSVAIRVVLTHIMLPGPKLKLLFDFQAMGQVIGQSRWVAVNSTITMIITHLDKLLIGYGFGFEVLGVYAIAQSIGGISTTIIDKLSTGLGVPVLRALADRPPEIRKRDYYRFRLPVDLYCVALSVGMVLLGPLFFKIVYDPRYALGGVLFAFLGLKVALLPQGLSVNFLLAELRFKLMMVLSAVRSGLFLAGMFLAIHYHSVTLMMLVVALQRLPEIILFYVIRRAGVPFDLKRDGAMFALTAVLGAYLVIMY